MAEDALPPMTDPLTPSQRAIKIAGWTALGLVMLVFFTLLKLPESRIKNLVQGYVSVALAERGISYTANQTELSYWLGVTYTLSDVTLNLPAPAAPVHIEKMEVSPSLFATAWAALRKKPGAAGSFWIGNAGGTLKGTFAMGDTDVHVSYKASKMDLGKLGVLPIAAGIQGGLIADGSGTLDGALNNPSSWDGKVQLDLSKIVVDAQSVQGFTLPKLSISEGKIDITIEKGKAEIKELKLGKAGNKADDLNAVVTGSATLGRFMNGSTLNLTAKFGLSENLMKSFSILDAILSQGKLADGTYRYQILGPVAGPQFNPMGPGATPGAAAAGGVAPVAKLPDVIPAPSIPGAR